MSSAFHNSHGSAVTFFTCGGQIHTFCKISSEFGVPKLFKLVHF